MTYATSPELSFPVFVTRQHILPSKDTYWRVLAPNHSHRCVNKRFPMWYPLMRARVSVFPPYILSIRLPILYFHWVWQRNKHYSWSNPAVRMNRDLRQTEENMLSVLAQRCTAQQFPAPSQILVMMFHIFELSPNTPISCTNKKKKTEEKQPLLTFC